MAIDPTATPELRRAWSAVVSLYQGVLPHLVDALEHDAEIDSGVYSALAYLDRAEPSGTLRLRRLQDLMHVRYSQPGLSRLVQRMEHDGLVERHADPDDGRSTVLMLTRVGRARLRKADEVYFRALAQHLGVALSDGGAVALAEVVEPITGRLIPPSD
jgi:DNA-binding MarR family transcriptional regulator